MGTLPDNTGIDVLSMVVDCVESRPWRICALRGTDELVWSRACGCFEALGEVGKSKGLLSNADESDSNLSTVASFKVRFMRWICPSVIGVWVQAVSYARVQESCIHIA